MPTGRPEEPHVVGARLAEAPAADLRRRETGGEAPGLATLASPLQPAPVLVPAAWRRVLRCELFFTVRARLLGGCKRPHGRRHTPGVACRECKNVVRSATAVAAAARHAKQHAVTVSDDAGGGTAC